ncbi:MULTISPECIES: ABC transporter ATP-binding protein [Thalassobaculum]|uniref:Peptide/nickel transport system ATP-binding protein n=1 Tax=Thalassobaculum litoreum DSM 18839 TaxID=1123362 RepID=A0A8G2BG42_9PROT|nr:MULTISPECIES: oligopeptide/dipeptide ABC transporter ATP-binding protein [Thalassobaculum]SDF50279.1 peptide/nickel transport system ATP-binding protein [Thalassobaculum litoreum DSM 18839]
MTTTPILEARDLFCTFQVRQGMFQPKRPLHAVNGVSLSIEKGGVLGLVGESGCGKSTVARMLLGLQEPTSGTLAIDGQPLEEIGRKQLAKRVQPIFQDPYSSLNPRKTIGNIITLPLYIHSIGDKADWRRKVEDIMDLCGLPKRAYDMYPSQLSGGQRQRVAIARALVMRPEIVICDEPTSALDVSVQAQILNLLLDLQKELGLTYVLISHNLAVVELIATKVAVMYLGRIVEEAEGQAFFAKQRHPYSEALLASVLTPQAGLGVPDAQLGTTFPNPIDPPPGCVFHPRCVHAGAVCKTTAPKTIRDGRGLVECHLYDDAVTV